jgi:hypothetical protein
MSVPTVKTTADIPNSRKFDGKKFKKEGGYDKKKKSQKEARQMKKDGAIIGYRVVPYRVEKARGPTGRRKTKKFHMIYVR